MLAIPISIKNVNRLRKYREFQDAFITAVAFSPDNRHIAYGKNNGEVVLLDFISGRAVGNFSTKLQVLHLEYSFGGKYLVGVANGLYVWDVETQDLILKQPGDILSLRSRFRSDEREGRIFIAHYDRVEILDTSSWKVMDEFKFHETMYSHRIISPGANWILSLGDALDYYPNDRPITVWNLKTNALEWSHSVSNTGSLGFGIGVCFHPSEDLVAIGEESHITIWRIPQGEIVSNLRFERGLAAPRLAFSPDGQLLAAGLIRGVIKGAGEDVWVDLDYVCVLWDWEWGAQLIQLPNLGKELVFSTDGSRLAVTNDEELQIWTVEETQPDNTRKPYIEEFPDYDNQGRPYGHPEYGDDW